ncbi:MAG: glycoside hydrolase family 5 protein [Colwellia sp.]
MKIKNKINNWRSSIKHHLSYAPLVAIALLVQSCDSSLLDEDADIDTLIPEPAVVLPDRPSPPEYALVMTTSTNEIFDASTNPVLLRGVNLQYGDDPEARLAGIAAIKATGANVVRLQLRATTTAEQLAAALDEIVANNMIAMPMLWEEEGQITCTESAEFIDKYTQELWFDEWIDVLVQEKYQAHLMINIANEWGVRGVWNANSIGYGEYIEVYKSIIREFREIGFKVPLVIDAPDCGQDYNAFLAERGLELQAADSEKNIVLSVHAYGAKYNTSNKIIAAADLLSKENVPFIIGEFGGSGEGATSIDHMDLMAKGIGDYALIFNLPWGGDTDKAGYAYSLEEATSFVGASVSADIYTPLDYVKDGKLGVQMYLRDSVGHYAALGTKIANDKELRGNAWTTINYTMQSTDDLAYVEEGFDLADITKVGIEVLANGKATDIYGDIKFDNIKVEVGGAEPPMYQANFDADTENWGIAWGDGDIYSEEGSLVLNKDWTASDQIVFSIGGGNANLDTSSPVTIAARVFIPEEYADEADLYFQFFFQHSDSWAWDQTDGKKLEDFTVGDWTDVVFENVDLTQAGTMHVVGAMVGGIYGAKTTNVLIDSITVLGEGQSTSAGGGGPMYYPTFDADTENWALYWGTSVVAAESGSLTVTPDWEVTEGNKFGFGLGGALANLDTSSPVTITAKVFIPASYADESGFYFKFFAQDEEWGWFQADDLMLDAFIPGEWSTITIEDIDFTAAVPTFQRFGIEIGGVSTAKAEPILIDYIAVLAEGQSIDGGGVLGLITSYEEQFLGETGSWVRDTWEDSTSNIAIEGETLAITQEWSTKDQAGMSVNGGIANLDTTVPVTITARVKVPASYADATEFFFKFYFQHSDWSGWNTTDNKALSDFTLGEWTEVTFEAQDFTMVQGLQAFGVQLGGVGSNNSDAILIDFIRVQIEGLVPVELDTLLDITFEEQSDADAWVFDYADGGFNESVLEEAKIHDYGVVPFGWLAWSWKGNGEGYEYLDMSTSENMVELTTRGEEIVHSANGIKATSIEAGFGE